MLAAIRAFAAFGALHDERAHLRHLPHDATARRLDVGLEAGVVGIAGRDGDELPVARGSGLRVDRRLCRSTRSPH